MVDLSDAEVEDKITTDEDFIVLRRYDFSAKKLVERHPNGAPTQLIADALKMTEEQLLAHEQAALEHLRKEMGVKLDE